jgi:hypothetical protein
MLDGVAITIGRSIAVGHELAAQTIEKGEIILKYSCRLAPPLTGRRWRIRPHAHNVASTISSTRCDERVMLQGFHPRRWPQGRAQCPRRRVLSGTRTTSRGDRGAVREQGVHLIGRLLPNAYALE